MSVTSRLGVNHLDDAHVLQTGDVAMKAMAASALVSIPFTVAAALLMAGSRFASVQTSGYIETGARILDFAGALGTLAVFFRAVDVHVMRKG